MTVRQTHCVTLGKFPSPWEAYVRAILWERLLCANTALGQRVTGSEINIFLSRSSPALHMASMKSECKSRANKHIRIHKPLFLFLACPSQTALFGPSLAAQGMGMVKGGAVTFTCVSLYHYSD